MSSTPGLAGDLIVFTDESGSDERLPSNSMRYRCVQAIVDLALRVLDTPQGRQVLDDIATRLVTTRNGASRPVRHLYRQRLSEMPQCIDTFLRKIKRNFPYVYLTITRGEGMAVKKDWGDDMAEYDPQEAVHLELNRVVINNLIYARQMPDDVAGNSYALFKYQMVITVAHEIAHFLTGYFTGTARPFTPRTVTLQGYSVGGSGEAGRYLESALLGGVVEFYENQQDPLRERQAGMPYLIDDGRSNSPARLISTTYILEFLNGDFSFPVRPSPNARPTTRNALRARTRETTYLRPTRARDAPQTTSPPRGNTPSRSSGSSQDGVSRASPGNSSAHRRLPDQPSYYTGGYGYAAERESQSTRGRRYAY